MIKFEKLVCFPSFQKILKGELYLLKVNKAFKESNHFFGAGTLMMYSSVLPESSGVLLSMFFSSLLTAIFGYFNRSEGEGFEFNLEI